MDRLEQVVDVFGICRLSVDQSPAIQAAISPEGGLDLRFTATGRPDISRAGVTVIMCERIADRRGRSMTDSPSLHFQRILAKALGGVLLMVIALGASACSIKREVIVPVPSRILRAKTASFQVLVTLVNNYSEMIHSLSSSTMRFTFRSGKIESGRLQEYRSAPGYVLLRRPDSIRVSIQNPITKTSIADLVSSGDEFSVWSPTENKFYEGKNSMKEFVVEGNAKTPSFSLRPIHIFDAILAPGLPLGGAGYRVAMEEDQDSAAKYYVLSLYREDRGDRLVPVRKYWIDRAEFTLARQQTYESSGQLTSIIHYSNLSPIDGRMLPLSIRIDRPLDGYSLNLEFKSWRVNPQLPDDAFILTAPAGAERIRLMEKSDSISLSPLNSSNRLSKSDDLCFRAAPAVPLRGTGQSSTDSRRNQYKQREQRVVCPGWPIPG